MLRVPNILVAVPPPPDRDRVRTLWRDLTDAPNGFTSNTHLVVGSDSHRASPLGWIGIVELCGDVVVACPTGTVDRLRHALAGSRAEQLTQPSYLDALLHPIETLGPAMLFYGRPTITTSARSTNVQVIGPIEIDDPRVEAVLDDASAVERDEAAVEDTNSGMYLGLAPDGTPASVCGWREWPHAVAHVSALTAASSRSRGFAVATAAVALDAAAARGLLPQWRAAHWNTASIALARHLGLSLLGHQYSLKLN